MYRAILLVLLSVVSISAKATEILWFAPPAVSSALGDTPIQLVLSAGNKSVTAIVDMPANSSFSSISVSIAANSTEVINLTSYLSQIEPVGGSVENTGLRIIATEMLYASYQVGNSTHMVSYDLKGTAALGKSFVIPGQNKWSRTSTVSPLPRLAVDVVATEDSTVVTFTLPSGVSASGHAAGSTFNITLNEGQTYSLYTTSSSDNFKKTTIKSTEHIAVSYTEDGVLYQSNTDIMGDQLVPVAKCGDSFAVVRGQLLDGASNKEYIDVMAVKSGTTSISSSFGPQTYNGVGESRMFDFTSSYEFFNGAYPMMCIQYTGIGNQISMSLVPDINDCSGSDSAVVYRPGADNFYVLIVVPTGSHSKFTTSISTNPFSSGSFSTMSGGIGYKYGIYSLSTSQVPSGSSFWIRNSSSPFQLFVLYGSNNNGAQFHLVTPFQFEMPTTMPIYHSE